MLHNREDVPPWIHAASNAKLRVNRVHAFDLILCGRCDDPVALLSIADLLMGAACNSRFVAAAPAILAGSPASQSSQRPFSNPHPATLKSGFCCPRSDARIWPV